MFFLMIKRTELFPFDNRRGNRVINYYHTHRKISNNLSEINIRKLEIKTNKRAAKTSKMYSYYKNIYPNNINKLACGNFARTP